MLTGVALGKLWRDKMFGFAAGNLKFAADVAGWEFVPTPGHAGKRDSACAFLNVGKNPVAIVETSAAMTELYVGMLCDWEPDMSVEPTADRTGTHLVLTIYGKVR